MILYLHGLNSAGASRAAPMDGQVPRGHGRDCSYNPYAFPLSAVQGCTNAALAGCKGAVLGGRCPGSAKAAVLRERLSPIQVLSPSYPAHQPEQAVEQLSRELEAHTREAVEGKQPIMLVGSSMGGFYGQYLARQFPLDHLVLINPALRPWDLLKQVVGSQYNEALDERYYLSDEMVAATRRFAIDDVVDGVPTTLLLDQGDELIDWRIAASIYAGSGDIHCYPGGSHAFEHMDEAVRLIRALHASGRISSLFLG